MNSVIVWSAVLVIWVILCTWEANENKSSFSTKWDFFFLGWTAANLLYKIFEELK